MQNVGTFHARVTAQIAEILEAQATAAAAQEKAAAKPRAPQKPVVEPDPVENGVKDDAGVKVEEDIDEPTTQEDDEEVGQLADDSYAVPPPLRTNRN